MNDHHIKITLDQKTILFGITVWDKFQHPELWEWSVYKKGFLPLWDE